MYSDQVKQDAKNAADYIRKHGWCQNRSEMDSGRVCAIGAMNKTCARVVDTDGIGRAVVNEIGGRHVWRWNDAPGRTKEEVLAVFDRIANS